MTFEPLIPSALWAALAVAAALAMIVYALRRPAIVPRGRWRAIIALMTLSAALVLLMLLNPTWVRQLPPPFGKPLLTVLVDSTRSMSTSDGGTGKTRYQQAAAIAQNMAHALGDEFEVHAKSFSGDAREVNPQDLAGQSPTGRRTDLAAALSSSLDLDRPQGQAIVLLSDGIDNVSGAENVLGASRVARSLGAPIYTRAMGTHFNGIDLAVELRPPQDLACVGQRVPITARVTHVGIDNGPVDLTLLENNRPLEKRTVELHAGAPTDTQFWVRHDKAGINFYEVRLTPLPSEITQANNTASYMLRVVDQPIRVLLLEGKPYWDSKFLTRTLASAPAVELESVVKLTDARLIHRTVSFAPADTTQPSGAAPGGTDGDGRGGGPTAPRAGASAHGARGLGADASAPHAAAPIGIASPGIGAGAAPGAGGNTNTVSKLTGYTGAAGGGASRGVGAAVPSDADASAQSAAATIGADPTTEPAAPPRPRVDTWGVETDASKILAGSVDLKRYQVIVLGRDAEAFLSEAAITRLQSWIARDGGSLVCYRGSPTAQLDPRLARLMPVRWEPAAEERFHLQMTAQGRDMNWLSGVAGADALTPLPALASSSRIDHSKPLAVVLATEVGAAGSAASPAAVYQPYGSGRVVVIEGSGMWRWAFLPPQFQEREQVYVSLWQSLLRWLVSGGSVPPGQTMALRADKVTFAADESATVTLAMREDTGAKVPVIVLVPEAGGKARKFTPAPLGDAPGAYRVDFGPLPQGRYQAAVEGAAPTDAAQTTLFEVRDISTEDIDLQPRPDLLVRVSQESGGAVLNSDDPREAASLFRDHMSRIHPPRFQRIMAWDHWWMLLIVLAAWTAAWSLRRSSGLV